MRDEGWLGEGLVLGSAASGEGTRRECRWCLEMFMEVTTSFDGSLPAFCFSLKHLYSHLVLLPSETSTEGAAEAAGEDRGEAEGAAGDGAQVQRCEGEGGTRDLQV